MQIISTTINDVANANGIGAPVVDILRRFQTVMADGASEIVLRRPIDRHKA